MARLWGVNKEQGVKDGSDDGPVHISLACNIKIAHLDEKNCFRGGEPKRKGGRPKAAPFVQEKESVPRDARRVIAVLLHSPRSIRINCRPVQIRQRLP
jgi:hypothetical protein